MAFGQQLQEVRRKAGLTQEEFAEDLQVSRQAVSKWESGKGYPEMEKILYICKRYGVSMAQLFDEETPSASAEEVSPLPKKRLHTSVNSFINNLSPKNKGLAVAAIVSIAILTLFIGACLRGGTYDMTLYIWIGAIVLFGIVEAATAGLTSIWFVLGSIAGLIVAICGGKIWLQVVLFFVVSIVALIATRPLVRRFNEHGTQPTNLDTVIGQTARVTEDIDNAVPTGAVYIQGKTWSARSEDETAIPAGTMVTVVRMEGVKLYVR